MAEAASQKLLQETAAMDALESQYAASLDFGGMSTDEVRFAWLRVASLLGPAGTYSAARSSAM